MFPTSKLKKNLCASVLSVPSVFLYSNKLLQQRNSFFNRRVCRKHIIPRCRLVRRQFWIFYKQLRDVAAFYCFYHGVAGNLFQSRGEGIGFFGYFRRTGIGEIFPLSAYAKTE